MSAYHWRPKPPVSARRRARRAQEPIVPQEPHVHVVQLGGELPDGAARHAAQLDPRDLAPPASTGGGILALVLLSVLLVVGALAAGALGYL